jgi:hypothetical protein
VYVSEVLAYTTSVDESFKEFKVKRIISAILISAALAFGFASCDDGAAGGGRGWDAVGMWKRVRTTYDERYEFKSNGTHEYTFNGKLEASGTWRYTTDIEIELTGFGAGFVHLRYNSATKELEHKMNNQTKFYDKQ